MRIAASVLLGLECVYVVAALVGAFRGSGGDAAGRALSQGYAAIAAILAVLMLLPAWGMLLTGHALIALVLCVLFLLPAIVALAA